MTNLEDTLAGLASRLEGCRVVAVAEAMPVELLIAHDTYKDKFDPHVWMDPARWTYVVRTARDTLNDVRPELADTFNTNTERH